MTTTKRTQCNRPSWVEEITTDEGARIGWIVRTASKQTWTAVTPGGSSPTEFDNRERAMKYLMASSSPSRSEREIDRTSS